MELGRRHAEDGRIGADLVQRGQSVESVERPILHSLGHHHPACLLKPSGCGMGGIGEDTDDEIDGIDEVGALLGSSSGRVEKVL